MKIIIPMAGRGSRLRPHTLTVPKPLLPIAGKPMVQRLVEDLSASFEDGIEEIAFIIGDFGEAVEKQLIQIAESMGAKGSIYHQDQPLGTAHAILCAEKSLSGNCIIAFSDTLFKADFSFDTNKDAIIWLKKVEDPSAFGVVKLNENNLITDFVEKPTEYVSDLAIVGIYYIRDAEVLKAEMQYLIDNDIKDKGEYQLTNALENMKNKGHEFHPAEIEEWLDCGNKDNVLFTNKRMLELKSGNGLVAASAKMDNAVIIEPTFIGENVQIRNAVIGPYVSIGNNSVIESSVINNSMIQEDSRISNANLENAMIGNKVNYSGQKSDVSLGDYSNLATG